MMHEHTLRVGRSARVVTLGPLEQPVASVWIALHGYGQLGPRFARRFASLDDGSRLVVVPEGLSRYYVDHGTGVVGASWMTREDRDREIDDYVQYLDDVAAWLPAGAASAPRTVLGFSQGSATAWRWLTRGTCRHPDRLIIWGGEIPTDLDLSDAPSRLRDMKVVLVTGTEDPYCPPAKLARYATQLEDVGLTCTTRTFVGGHDLDAATLAALAA